VLRLSSFGVAHSMYGAIESAERNVPGGTIVKTPTRRAKAQCVAGLVACCTVLGLFAFVSIVEPAAHDAMRGALNSVARKHGGGKIEKRVRHRRSGAGSGDAGDTASGTCVGATSAGDAACATKNASNWRIARQKCALKPAHYHCRWLTEAEITAKSQSQRRATPTTIAGICAPMNDSAQDCETKAEHECTVPCAWSYGECLGSDDCLKERTMASCRSLGKGCRWKHPGDSVKEDDIGSSVGWNSSLGKSSAGILNRRRRAAFEPTGSCTGGLAVGGGRCAQFKTSAECPAPCTWDDDVSPTVDGHCEAKTGMEPQSAVCTGRGRVICNGPCVWREAPHDAKRRRRRSSEDISAKGSNGRCLASTDAPSPVCDPLKNELECTLAWCTWLPARSRLSEAAEAGPGGLISPTSLDLNCRDDPAGACAGAEECAGMCHGTCTGAAGARHGCEWRAGAPSSGSVSQPSGASAASRMQRSAALDAKIAAYVQGERRRRMSESTRAVGSGAVASTLESTGQCRGRFSTNDVNCHVKNHGASWTMAKRKCLSKPDQWECAWMLPTEISNRDASEESTDRRRAVEGNASAVSWVSTTAGVCSPLNSSAQGCQAKAEHECTVPCAWSYGECAGSGDCTKQKSMGSCMALGAGCQWKHPGSSAVDDDIGSSVGWNGAMGASVAGVLSSNKRQGGA
jgi:hypothetical protein